MITSVISMKGGTAKTTTAVNLAAYLALGGLRVLLIDLDPQNFATISAGLERREAKATIASAFLEDGQLAEAIHPGKVPNLDIIPGDRRLASTDVMLADTKGRERILKGKIDKLQQRYNQIG